MKKIAIPASLVFKLYLSLFISLAIICSVFYALYFVGGWMLATISAAPLILVFTLKFHAGGLVITKEQFPRLFHLIKDVSTDLQVKMPDKVKLHPASEISVGGIFSKDLNIGIAALRSLSVSEFKAILAHEFGHFYGQDTIIGGVLWRIHHSLEHAARFGGQFSQAVPIAFLALVGLVIHIFYALYGFLFKLALLAYSRQVEYRADYIAAKIAGANNFRKGLINYSTFSQYFSEVGYNSIITLLQQNKLFINVYGAIYDDYKKRDIESFKTRVIDIKQRGFLSTHPALKNRLAFIKAGNSKTDSKPATSLFKHFKNLEKDMTVHLSRAMYQQIQPQLAWAAAQQSSRRTCEHCGQQFDNLNDFFKHELTHEKEQG